MSWQAQIQPSGVWSGVEGYALERISELTQICVAAESSETDIRRAQAGILELHRLLDLPKTISAQAQIRASASTRKEY